jgi:hypothetical protein
MRSAQLSTQGVPRSKNANKIQWWKQNDRHGEESQQEKFGSSYCAEKIWTICAWVESLLGSLSWKLYAEQMVSRERQEWWTDGSKS